MLPGKPFSLDNFNSLGADTICTQNGLARLGIPARHIMALLPFYLGPFTGPTELNAARKSID
jgi:NADH dehydrogenase